MSDAGWLAIYEQGAVAAARHYLSYVTAHQGDLAALECKRSHLLQAMSACAQLPHGWPLVIDCARAAHDYMRRSGQCSLWQPYLRLALQVAQKLGDPRAGADLCAMLASVHHDMGQWTQAAEHYACAISFYEQAGPSDELIRALAGKAQSERMMGNIGQALALCRRALSLADAVGDKALLGLVHSILGSLELDESRLGAALEHLKQAQTYLMASDSPEGLARIHNVMARIHYAQGHWEAAIRHMHLSLEAHQRLGDAWMEAQTNANLGILYHALGRWYEAEQHLRRAIAVAEEVGAAEALANSHGNLGRVLRDQGRWAEALDHLIEALGLGTVLGHRRLVGNCYANLAHLSADEGAWDRALYCIAQAREIADQLGDAMLRCDTDLCAGAVYRGKGQLDAAEAAYQQVLTGLAVGALDNRQLQADALEGLAAVKRARGQPLAALELLDQALSLRIGRSDWVGLLSTLVAIAEAQAALGDLAALQVALICAEELAARLDRPDLIARLYILWGDLALQSPGTADLETAYRAYSSALELTSSGRNDRLRRTHTDVRDHLRAWLEQLARPGASKTARKLHTHLLEIWRDQGPERPVPLAPDLISSQLTVVGGQLTTDS